MNISEEEKQINRPLLYLTGGLVLGETMALWMTAEECFWLAAVLLVFACLKFIGSFRIWKDKRMVPAFFVCMGLIFGVFRMEWEEWMFKREEEILEIFTGKQEITGEIEQISSTDYGYRLILRECCTDGGQIRRMFCYLDQVENLRIGMRVHVTGTMELPECSRNPGQFDFRAYCKGKGIAGIVKGNTVNLLSSEYFWIREAFRCFREQCRIRIEKIAEPSDYGILNAILLGDKAQMDEEIYEMYQKNGISHVLAVSGLHVSVIGMGIWRVLRKIGMGYWGAGTLAFSCLFAYGSIVGFGPSVVRAVSMMAISFLAEALGRTYDLPSALCIPALGLLWMHPMMITQAAFQLSFLAVGAIFFPGEYLAVRWKWRGWKKKVLVSASIQMVTMPVVLYHSYEIPPYGILLNLVVVPLMSYVLISGIVSLLFSFINLSIASFCLGGAHYILRFYTEIGTIVRKVPGAHMVLGCPSLSAIGLFYLILAAAVVLSVRKRPEWIGMAAAGILLLVPVSGSGLNLTFLDVGQGDGILLEADGKTMLVDCGSSQDRSVGADCLVPFLKYHGICQLNTVIISHVDLDHTNGIRYLLENPDCGISVGKLVLPDDGTVDEEEEEIICLAQELQIPLEFWKAGDHITDVLGKECSVFCLNPPGNPGADRNENSLVLQVEYGQFRALLTGDAGMEAERSMLGQGDLKPTTLLKAGHHGSESSSSEGFLKAISPQYAVLSYGEGNSYGHPAESVRKRLGKTGTDIYETAKEGAIHVWTDGKETEITGWFDIREGI